MAQNAKEGISVEIVVSDNMDWVESIADSLELQNYLVIRTLEELKTILNSDEYHVDKIHIDETMNNYEACKVIIGIWQRKRKNN